MKSDELVFFNIWETRTEDDRTKLVDAMRGEADWIAEHDGFVSLEVWSSADDLRVIVEARWRSAANFQAAIAENPEAQARRAAMAKFGEPKAGLYDLAFVIGRERSGE